MDGPVGPPTAPHRPRPHAIVDRTHRGTSQTSSRLARWSGPTRTHVPLSDPARRDHPRAGTTCALLEASHVRVGRRVRSDRAALVSFGALVAAVGLVLAVAAPVLAAGPVLFDPIVTPRTGTTTTDIAFHIMYKDSSGEGGPDVWVTVGGQTHRMHSDPGSTPLADRRRLQRAVGVIAAGRDARGHVQGREQRPPGRHARRGEHHDLAPGHPDAEADPDPGRDADTDPHPDPDARADREADPEARPRSPRRSRRRPRSRAPARPRSRHPSRGPSLWSSPRSSPIRRRPTAPVAEPSSPSDDP